VKYGTGYLHVMSLSSCVYRGNRCGESHTLPKGLSDIPPPTIFCLFFCPIRINVGTGYVDKIVLSGYDVHENWSMESRTCGKSCPCIRCEGKYGVEA
jgi:hypothetical protein